ncbi:MAG: NosD domain-containing protein [Candidatus Nitrosocosmicus sp.]
MNNKLYLMTAILAFASVGALLSQPTLMASAQKKSSSSALDAITGTSSDTTSKKSTTKSAASASDDNIPTASLSCGQVIKTSVKLSSNLDCSSDGLLVGADGITIDLNGHSITGPGPDKSKIGLSLATSSGVTIEGPGTVSGFQAGVLDTGGQGDTIDQVTFQNNQIALFATGAKDTTITHNMILDNDIGVASHSSTGTHVSLNTMTGNKLAGVTMVNSPDNKIDTNIIEEANNGIFLDAQSTSNDVISNMVMKNTGVDLNNANGLPINVNKNTFTGNNCQTSVPDGLCVGGQ